MTLSRRAALFLLAFGAWSWVIWPTFLSNIWADERSWAPSGGPAPFFVVHAVLTAASLLFGTIIGLLGWRGLAAARRAAKG
ncbi:SCO4848 family membrane protein [Actinokineospora sp. G85]|uniref:SCO4848 family membrane protein n=1 Tax=Actinokineospora sp. G85 TaxID=3406626 RepID=UPI003C762D55